MSNRAYNILRAYIGREFERIRGLERLEAMEELERPADWERLEGMDVPRAESQPIADPKEYARRLLGVSETATFNEIRTAFERLNERSSPAGFPVGSDEEREAREINKRVNWAYGELAKDFGDTEKRFSTLEFD